MARLAGIQSGNGFGSAWTHQHPVSCCLHGVVLQKTQALCLTSTSGYSSKTLLACQRSPPHSADVRISLLSTSTVACRVTVLRWQQAATVTGSPTASCVADQTRYHQTNVHQTVQNPTSHQATGGGSRGGGWVFVVPNLSQLQVRGPEGLAAAAQHSESFLRL